MKNEEISHAHAIMTYPVNPDFASLNLANAVAVFSFCWGEAKDVADAPSWFRDSESPPAVRAEFDGFLDHLETELVRGRFYHPPAKAPLMRQNLRNLFLKARLTEQEVRTLRGVVKALTVGRGGRKLEP
jgi:tRNA/rRNA methyltransferase